MLHENSVRGKGVKLFTEEGRFYGSSFLRHRAVVVGLVFVSCEVEQQCNAEPDQKEGEKNNPNPTSG